ncbi:MAG: hypothetical protein SF187_23670 [Deltaproteobacteria bacterium]|nr:hypothetical protein [Deltaproteobacteria bacterium]
MVTTAIICPQCQRVLALGARLPATCFGAIAPAERERLSGAALEADERSHKMCVQIDVQVPDELNAEQMLAEVTRIYADQIAALGALALGQL